MTRIPRHSPPLPALALLAGLAAATALAIPATAQTYPQRAVTVVVPFPPGGASDSTARLVSPKAGEVLGQPLVIDNRPGANGGTGATHVKTSPADGYTLLVGSIGVFAINPALNPALSYSPKSDFDLITVAVRTPNVLVATPNFPANSVKELVAHLKNNPNKVTFASSGVGSSDHLTAALFWQKTGTSGIHVPYKGGGPAIGDLIAGHADVSFQNLGAVANQIKAGKLKALGVTAAGRNPVLPDVPTLKEAGVDGIDVYSWQAAAAPKGLPADVKAKVVEAFKISLADPAVKAKFTELGFEVVANTPAEFAALGYAPEDWAGRPVIAILNTWSDFNSCHAHFKDRVADIKRGVLQAGGFPLEVPVHSVSETFLKPTSMLYRNMLAMEVEEVIRAHPVDGVVLMGGCDKSTPALLMGATSAAVPAIYVPAGPMLRGNWNGKTLGSGSDAWKFWDERRAGNIGEAEWHEIEGGIARSYGHCMTMGTASTMTAIAEAIGMTLTGASSVPAADAGHIRMCAASGRRIVEMVWEDLVPARVQTRAAFGNAIIVAMAMGCSTNAIIHLIAQARRAGCDITLDDFDSASHHVPVLANVRPSGDAYLMEDFYFAGGLPALMGRLTGFLHLDALTVSGRTVGEAIAGAKVHNDDVIRPLDQPIYAEGALAVLRGNLAPEGCVIKPSACAPHLRVHTGPALVFDDYPSLKAATDDETLDVSPDHVLVLRNAGPLGGPGMPEWGMLPIPKTLVKQGVRDMLRISDARMSGTSYGACILHVSPESHVGGPLALLRTGDLVTVDVPNRRIDMEVSAEELERRRTALPQPVPRYERGYGWMYSKHISQAHLGCDFDFLETTFGAAPGEPAIY